MRFKVQGSWVLGFGLGLGFRAWALGFGLGFLGSYKHQQATRNHGLTDALPKSRDSRRGTTLGSWGAVQGLGGFRRV